MKPCKCTEIKRLQRQIAELESGINEAIKWADSRALQILIATIKKTKG